MSNIALVPNIYYEARGYNPTTQPVPATQDEALIYPLLRDASKYQVGVAKAIIPLSQVPLTQSNLPLKGYQVGIQQGTYSGTAYVRQVNSNTDNYLFTSSGLVITTSIYTSTGTTFDSTTDVSPFMNYLYSFVVDNYLNLYCAGSSSNPNNADTIYIIGVDGSLLQTLALNNVSSIFINPAQTLFIADGTETGGTIQVYSNENSANNVNLSLLTVIDKDFANNQLTNVVFVVATLDRIIVGHDTNILTYYNNPLFTAITDYTVPLVVQFTAGNVLNGDDILMTADSVLLNDTLYGVLASGAVANIETNTTLTGLTAGSAMACTNNGYGFVAGVNSTTYNLTLPIVPVQNFTQVNTTTAIVLTVANKDGLYAIGTGATPNFSVWDSTVSKYYTCNTNFKIGANNIISMDYNVNTDKAVAVDSNHNLWKSNVPIMPYNLMYWQNNNQVLTLGASPNNISEGQITARQVNNISIANIYGIAQWGAYVYTIEGVPGSQVIVQRSFTDFGLTSTGTTYNLVETAGTIKQICVFNTFLCVYDGTNTLRIYTLGTNTQLHNSGNTYANTVYFSMSSLDNNDNLLIAADTILGVANISAFIPVGAIYTAPTNIIGCCTNIGDTSPNGLYTTFTITGGNNGSLLKQVWNNGYNGVASSTQIATSGATTGYKQIFCNPYQGIIYGITGFSSEYDGTASLYAQNNNYALAYIMNFGYGGDLVNSGFYLPNNASNPYAWTQQTSNIPLKSVCVSRNDSNTLYGISNTNSTTYSGSLLNNSITFTQISAYASQTYNYISTTINTNNIVNSTLRTFTISSQAPIATLGVPNQKIFAIGANEISRGGSFLVPTGATKTITSYTPTLTVNYTFLFTGETYLFVKNGEDIDAGAVSIFSYSVLIDAINAAFAEAYTRLQVNNSNPLTEAPKISLNYSTGICTLTYSQDYTTSAFTANPTNGILFNSLLTQLIYFSPNIPSTNPAFADYGLNIIGLPVGSTSFTQTSGTIYQFNQLDKIGIQSNTIFVSDSYFGNNQTNRIITTIDVPTAANIENLGTVLYFQPQFMRPYTLASTNAIDRIQIQVLYQYRDFSTYQLNIGSGQNWSVLLDFIKKF